MPSVRRISAPLPRGRARAPLAPKPAAAVALGLVLAAGALAGCEYTYDDARTGTVQGTASAAPAPAFTRDPLQQDPVSEAELGDWVSRALPDGTGPVVQADAGLLAPAEVRTISSPVLKTGTYTLAIACRSQRRVTFTVRTETLTLVDLGLRCGINRENVIYLSTDSVLTVRVEARTAANYAFCVYRL
ncbi:MULTISPECIES: hypothetical protein [unclassified Arthrobacter]|uniref:hypothetical protein n=1 Tax=unclassified Arthrobacter TaxID=235627 RepID=UPI000476A3ED|nr:MULTISPECIES: hypothetical protein [unclassified Arthrobacter]BCW55935.1 hypothetical protein StoSoilB19_33090 [Arthrobacter sp. StoSoilB19]BCW77033.1 hypothetical protein NicSoilB11_33580 [Arthrobacter sp. NicSoilB11]